MLADRLRLVELVWLRARLAEDTDLLADTLVEIIGRELGKDWARNDGGGLAAPSASV